MTALDQVTQMIAKQLKIAPEKIKPESRLLEDLRADSANVMMLVMDLEQALDMTMEDDALMTMKTVDDVVKYIEAHR